MRKRSWSLYELENAVRNSFSYRQVLKKLGLREAGGNYEQIKKYVKEFQLPTQHLRGKGWNKGLKGVGTPRVELKDILVQHSSFQSYKLKKRLYKENLKNPSCEECGWAKKRNDGIIPVELDHINGDRHDNRLENLRILCPNCHSLKSTHRGRNIKTKK